MVVVVVVAQAMLWHIGVCPAMRKLAPNLGGRTPGSQTPGVPATSGPRQPTTVGHRGLSRGTESETCRIPAEKGHPAMKTRGVDLRIQSPTSRRNHLQKNPNTIFRKSSPEKSKYHALLSSDKHTMSARFRAMKECPTSKRDQRVQKHAGSEVHLLMERRSGAFRSRRG